MRDDSRFGRRVGWVAARGSRVSMMRRFPDTSVSHFLTGRMILSLACGTDSDWGLAWCGLPLLAAMPVGFDSRLI
jgi:hypothetical protein